MKNHHDPNTQANLLWQSYWQQAQASLPLSDTFEADFWEAYEPLIQQKKSSNIQLKPPTPVQDELAAKFYKYWKKAFVVEKTIYATKANNVLEVVLGGCFAYVLMGALFVGSLVLTFAGQYQGLKYTIPALLVVLIIKAFFKLNDTNEIDYSLPPEKKIMIALSYDHLKVTELDSGGKRLEKRLYYECIHDLRKVKDGFVVLGKVNGVVTELKVPSGETVFNEIFFFLSEVLSYNYLRKQA